MRYHVMLEVEAVKLNEQDKRLLPNTYVLYWYLMNLECPEITFTFNPLNSI